MVESTPPAEARIDGFIDRYLAEIAAKTRECRARLHDLFPRGYELIYDNYNALVFGFGPTTRSSDAILSLVVYPKWLTLCFLNGATLPDPDRLLQGSGNQVRTIRLDGPNRFDDPQVLHLVDRAGAQSADLFANAPPLTAVIKSISAKQRPRQPTGPLGRNR